MIFRWIEQLSLALASMFLPEGYEIKKIDKGAEFLAHFAGIDRSR